MAHPGLGIVPGEGLRKRRGRHFPAEPRPTEFAAVLPVELREFVERGGDLRGASLQREPDAGRDQGLVVGVPQPVARRFRHAHAPPHEHLREVDRQVRVVEQRIAEIAFLDVQRLAPLARLLAQPPADSLHGPGQVLLAGPGQFARIRHHPDAEAAHPAGPHQAPDAAVPEGQRLGHRNVRHPDRIGFPDQVPDGHRPPGIEIHDLIERGGRVPDGPQVGRGLPLLDPAPASQVLVHQVPGAVVAEAPGEQILHDGGDYHRSRRADAIEQFVVRQLQLGHQPAEVPVEHLGPEAFPLVVVARPVHDADQRSVVGVVRHEEPPGASGRGGCAASVRHPATAARASPSGSGRIPALRRAVRLVRVRRPVRELAHEVAGLGHGTEIPPRQVRRRGAQPLRELARLHPSLMFRQSQNQVLDPFTAGTFPEVFHLVPQIEREISGQR